MDENVKKFKEIRQLFKRLSDEMCTVVESYYIWRALEFAVSIPEVGKEKAERNVKIISRYNDFFQMTKYSHFKTFVLGINIFFDKSKGSLSLESLIREINKYQYVFKPEVVKVALDELNKLGFVPGDYKPIDQSTIDKINSLKEGHKEVLETLESVRDKQIAHTAVVSEKKSIVPVEVENLISAIQEMFNILSAKFDLSSTLWDHLKDAATGATEYLLEDLEKGDVKRMEERDY